jgi:hypothetical protein
MPGASTAAGADGAALGEPDTGGEDEEAATGPDARDDPDGVADSAGPGFDGCAPGAAVPQPTARPAATTLTISRETAE